VIRRVFEAKERQDDYDLPEIGKWVGRLFKLSVLLLAGTALILIGVGIYEFIFFGSSLILTDFVIFIAIVVLMEFILFLSVIWSIRGDFPVDIRIFEIEYREELLAKAQEFKEMD
jgi:hypothetical protein